jgi:hypothetical protein
MKDMMFGFAFMAVYMPLVAGWLMVSDEMLEKFADKVYDFFFAPIPKPEPKVHGDLVAMFGEAADA